MVASMQKDTDMTNAAMLTTFILLKMQENSLFQNPNSDEKSLEETEIRSQNSDRDHIEDLKEISAIDKTKETKEKSTSNNIAKQPNSSKDFVKTDTNNFHLTDKSVNGETVLCQENGDVSDIAISDSRKYLKAKTDLYSKMSPRKSSKNLSKNFDNKDNAKRNGSLVFGDAERQHDAQ